MPRPIDTFTIAFKHSPLALTITSLESGQLVDVNDGFVRLSGYTREEALGKTPDELGLWIQPELRAVRFQRLRRGEPVPEVEARFRLKDGREVVGIIGSAVVEIEGVPCVLSSVLDITERKRAELSAIEHEQRYRAIVESQVEMVCRFQRDGTILFANTAYAHARSTTADALVGANFWNFVPPQDHQAVAALLDSLTPDAPEVHIENRFETGEGVRWTLWTNRALTFDERGRPHELQSSGLDITDRRRTEEALRKSENRYRQIFETAGVSIWDQDLSDVKRAIDHLARSGVDNFREYFRDHPDWVDRAIAMVRIREVNSAALRLLGARTQEELLAALPTVFLPEMREVFIAVLRALAEGHSAVEAETTLGTLDGRRLDVLFMSTFPPHGTFDSVLVTLTDITDRKRAEVALRESEAQMRSFANTAPAMLWVTDAEGECTFVSRAWYEFTGQTEQEALGRGWLQAVHPEDSARSAAHFDQATRQRELFFFEYRLRRTDGTYRWMIDCGRPRFSADGRFAGFVGSVIDIHDRKMVELQLRDSEAHFRQMAEALQKSSQTKDEFLATLSHELRTPLNAVLGWAHMLRSGGLPPDVAARALDSLERNARAQTQLIDDLLDMSRIVSGRLQISHDAVDLSGVIAAAADTLRLAAVTKGVDLQVSTPPNEQLCVTGDADRLRQILWNLLSNAIKFTPLGGRIQLELRGDDARVEVLVRDTGEGIEPAFLPHVFERFRQADATSTRRHGGLGLGLSIARHLAEAHGGSIAAASEGRGRGATFILQLPRRRAAAPASASTAADHQRRAQPLAGASVLVVDDEADTRELFRVALELAGATVTAAASAVDALHLLHAGRIDVALVDVGMPHHDGMELVRAIRALPAPLGQLPAIAVTAYTSPRVREQVFDAGFNAHVSKPIEVDRLLSAVLTALYLHDARPIHGPMR